MEEMKLDNVGYDPAHIQPCSDCKLNLITGIG